MEIMVCVCMRKAVMRMLMLPKSGRFFGLRRNLLN